MARIFYSMAGEGRGHAARVRSMVEQLRHDHELVLFAPDQAYEFLAPRYPVGFANVEVRRIPGLRFHYTRERLDLTRSVAHGLGYLWKLPGLVRELTRVIRAEQPDLVIADFEPSLPRAARACGVPFVSLNHQHFLVACDLSSLPLTLQGYARLMGLAVRAHHPGQAATIVSSFFQAPLLRGYENVVQVGPLLRPEIKSAARTRGDYLLSYLRPSTPIRVLELLKLAGREVRVYGLGGDDRSPDGPLQFRRLSERTFAEDLAGCAGLIGAAGNQTLGEALYLGKPVLALPEERHHEQLINAHFLRQMGAGDFATIEAVERTHIARFVARLDNLAAAAETHRSRLDGTPAALAAVRRHLPQPGRQASRLSRTHGSLKACPTGKPALLLQKAFTSG
jgi:uncharacterized protein (TIGR00661 family)